MLVWSASAAESVHAQAGASTADAGEGFPAGTPKSWAEAAVQHQLAIIKDDAHPMRYLIRKVDRKGDTTREVIESAQGNVARLVQRNGKPITAAEDAAERERLNSILASPGEFLKHQQREGAGKNYALQVIKLMPSATLYSYTPGQPQPAGATSPQVVIDFRPDPAFHPPTMVSELLTGLQGRVWIDARTGTMTRMEANITRPVNFGWGIVGRVYPGGRLEFEQTFVDGKRWAYSHLDENVTVREMMLRTVNDKSRMTAWNFQLLPAPISYQDAVHELLAKQIPVQ
ncbi:MAG TPA: hypothetical protein VFA99_08105 [Acidobacteriaceae bacterium]|nr:hypothetical protein [Acidobacteriaceae bacterium]